MSAVPLTPEQTEKLRQKAQQMTGKAVELTVKLDKRVLGGIRLELDGVQLDGTVRSRLETLSHRIENTVL